ncbi:MAG: nitroreductase family protein [Candidatus Nanohaloarchaea archaeon]
MSAFEQIRELPSFRKARDEVISRKVVGKVVEAGRNAPSPGNVQSAEFIVVEDSGQKEVLYRATQDERVREAPTAVLVVAGFDRMQRRVGEDAEKAAYSEAATAVQNMRIVAAEQDVASAWLGGFDERAVSEKFGVPEGRRIVAAVLLAYTDNPVYTEQRFDIDEVVFYDKYDNQINSFWDEPGWRGLRTESRIHGKKAEGFFQKVRRKLDHLL